MPGFEEREGLRRESSPDRVVVIGGGLAGLSAAHELRKRGIRPVVFEALDHVGGRAFGDRVDGFTSIRARTSSVRPTMSPFVSARSWKCPWRARRWTSAGTETAAGS